MLARRSWAGGAALADFHPPESLAPRTAQLRSRPHSPASNKQQRVFHEPIQYPRMTSPAITKSPENQKGDKKSPTHSAGTTDPAAADAGVASTSSAPPRQPDVFSWLRIFKLADLMMKQGC